MQGNGCDVGVLDGDVVVELDRDELADAVTGDGWVDVPCSTGSEADDGGRRGLWVRKVANEGVG